MDGNLAKVTILGFIGSDILPTGIPFSMYTAMFNPEQLATSKTIQYDCSQAMGSQGSQLRYSHTPPRVVNLDFLIDGTGATGESREVLADIALFRLTTGFLGDLHRPSYLMLNWGTFVFNCVLTKMDVKYTLFRPNGTPLRATISASFKEHTPSLLQSLLNNLSSPDLTHERTIKAGDTLPLMTYNIYKDPRYYLEIAKANDLDNFRELPEGEQLKFPPIEDSLAQ